MLQERIREHKSHVWLVNTGWIGGAYGTGNRINLPYTRSMITSALTGQINLDKLTKEPVFGLAIPTEVTGVPGEILDQRLQWKDLPSFYKMAEKLQTQFENSLAQFKI